MKQASESVGAWAEGIQVDAAALRNLQPPMVAWWGGNHFVALLAIKGDSVRIHDPNGKSPETIPMDEFIRKSGGIVLTVSE